MPDSSTEDTLLLVDPDLDFLDWATKHLAANNLRILRCDNAANALKVVEKTRVGVVVAAMEMEPFDGMEFLGRVLQHSPQVMHDLVLPVCSQASCKSRSSRSVKRTVNVLMSLL